MNVISLNNNHLASGFNSTLMNLPILDCNGIVIEALFLPLPLSRLIFILGSLNVWNVSGVPEYCLPSEENQKVTVENI